ncbi:hypothetical protein E0H73_39255 [Kribbella pittospori]|uniref:Uncharacterized protein n=1 Tax=Kribbella pittospori TaxID=722689 RepID=A0A4R0KFA3_9ACTN|nr:hypothetical protein [Kribbella pittospori]TCC54195.1 hypothetical protein E0H73_39255 [Kribbella pittospori]
MTQPEVLATIGVAADARVETVAKTTPFGSFPSGFVESTQVAPLMVERLTGVVEQPGLDRAPRRGGPGQPGPRRRNHCPPREAQVDVRRRTGLVMHASVRLGRIAGIPVCLDLSVFAILVILVAGRRHWPSARGLPRPQCHGVPDCRDRCRRPVLRVRPAHEIVARCNGIEVNGITLWRSAA